MVFYATDELPDRIVAICLAASLDAFLTEAIQYRLFPAERCIADLFRDGGALGSLGTKVLVGHVLGLYDQESYADLNRICKIRDRFAHLTEAQDFESDPVKGLIDNLTLPVRDISSGGNENWKMALAPYYTRPPASSRERFTNTCDIACMALYLETVEAPRPQFRPRF